jgi:hypothetical protein
LSAALALDAPAARPTARIAVEIRYFIIVVSSSDGRFFRSHGAG